jgi:F-type H+-transporting ATPase subunit a
MYHVYRNFLAEDFYHKGLKNMESLHVLDVKLWHPFAYFGLTHPFFALNADTIVYTWVTLALIVVTLVVARVLIALHNDTAWYLASSFVETFSDMVTETLGFFSLTHVSVIASFFIFIVVANCMPLIPYLEEPTADLNTTLALGLISFLYVQCYTIKAHGIVDYLKEYTQPLFVMAPLHIMGKCSTILSISFRLFGNIFGGATISKLYLSSIKGSLITEILGIATGLNFVFPLFFGLLEGLLQAFVFAMLTLTYVSIGITHQDNDAQEG